MKVSKKTINSLMAANLITQGKLAEMANLSRATVNVTLQRGSCNAVTAGKIADALGVDPAEIIETEE